MVVPVLSNKVDLSTALVLSPSPTRPSHTFKIMDFDNIHLRTLSEVTYQVYPNPPAFPL